MMKLSLALLVVGIVLCVEARPRGRIFKHTVNIPQIVGGRQVSSKARWPWQLSLMSCGLFGCSHICGAVVHSSTHAVTAAHCTENTAARDFRIAAGQLRRSPSDAEQTVDVSRKSEHNNYGSNRPGIPNDIATLTFDTRLRLGGNVIAATLPNAGESFTGDECWISGWGRTSGLPGGSAANILKEARMRVLTTGQCRNLMPINLADDIRDTHICVNDGGADVSGSCQGDSGGPLHCRSGGVWKVAGVTSWGVGSEQNSCMQDYPAVYTRLSSYLNWIRNNT